MGLLEEAVPPLGEGHLPVRGVLYLLDLYLPSSHILSLYNLVLESVLVAMYEIIWKRVK